MIVLQSVKEYKLFYCKSNDEGRRLDRVLKVMLPDVPAGLIYSGIRKGMIRVNGKKSSQEYHIQEKDVIWIRESIKQPQGYSKPEIVEAVESHKEKLEKLIILQTDNLCFINKPAGMLTHGKASLAELVKAGLPDIEESLSFTPAPLHRLDRNTSGLIAVSRTLKGAVRFTELMRNRALRKYYIGLCIGQPSGRRTLEDGLVRKRLKTETGNGGKKAKTTLTPLLSSGGLTLCLFEIETGVTHQIRSQLSGAGFPLAGDAKYDGRLKGFRTYILHSFAIVLPVFDDVAGFKYVSADLPFGSLRKLEGFFDKKTLSDALSEAKNKIIN